MAFPFAQISAGANGNLGIISNDTFHLCKLKPRALATLEILCTRTGFSRPRDQKQLCCPVQVLRRQSSAGSPAPAGLQQGTWSTPGAHLEPPKATAPSPLTPMHAEVTAVLVQGFQRGDIRSSRSNLIHPLDGLHHFVPLLLCKDGGTLVLGNLLWGRNKIPVRSMSCSYGDSQSLSLSFHGQVNFTAGLSSDLDQSVVAKEAPDRSENILIRLHFLNI